MAKHSLRGFPLLQLTDNGLAKMTERLSQLGLSSLNEIEDMCPCSPMQQSLLLSQTRNSAYYTGQFIFEVKAGKTAERINNWQLMNAWQKVVDQHRALRTVFVDSVHQ